MNKYHHGNFSANKQNRDAQNRVRGGSAVRKSSAHEEREMKNEYRALHLSIYTLAQVFRSVVILLIHVIKGS
jgi:hypothetical protein